MAFQQTDNHDDNNHLRLYNPYQGLQLQIPIKTLYQLPTSPEYLFHEQYLQKSRRNWSENLTFCTGAGYLTGSLSGVLKGLATGVRASEPGDTMKLRLNRVLNGSAHAGRWLGNRAGVIGLLYAGMENGLMKIRDTVDVINSVAAGLGTGVVYRAAKGVRSAAVAGFVGAAVVGLALAAKRYVPI